MRRSTGFQEMLPGLFSRRPSRELSEGFDPRRWQSPTLGEFIRQVEHGFGDAVDLSSLYLNRADRDQQLTPISVRAYCELLGVPPEDFGV